jgi:hypothetical protein
MSSELSIVTEEQGELILTPTQAEFLPFAHHDAWAKLGATEQVRIRERIQLFDGVKNAKRGGVVEGLREISNQRSNARGFAFSTLRGEYYAWLNSSCDWRSLCRGYSHDTALPDAFVAELGRRVLLQHRSRKQAIEEIRTEWREGRAVPGYGTWREWFLRTFPDAPQPAQFCGDYPRAWSTSNLYLHMPSNAQYALATRGRAAAQKFIHGIVRDTSKLRPMELIVLDDFEPDTMAIFEGRVVRSTGLKAMDVGTRRTLALGMKPRVENDEGRQISIVRADVQFLLKQIFGTWGLPAAYPMTILVENAAAAVTSDLEAAIDLYFHGQVRIVRTGLIEHKTVSNGFIERGGKPWEKSWLESSWNLTHNMAGSLPGQKGARYDLKPGDLAAKIAYSEKILATDGLTPEQISDLRVPFLSFDQQVSAYGAIFDRMDRRTNHKLQGFDKVQEFRLGPGDPWKPIGKLGLLTGDQQKVAQIREPSRMESPVERWDRLAAECRFIKVPEFLLALLTFTPKRVGLRNHAVSFTHREVGYSFLDMRGDLQGVPDGTKFMGYFDEQAPARLFVTDLAGRPVAVLDRKGGLRGAADIKDADAIGAAARQVAEFYHSQIEGPVKELLAGERAQAEADREHNRRQLIAWGLQQDLPESERPRRKLSATLAQDSFTAPAEGRFAAAATTAQGIAAHTQQLKDNPPQSATDILLTREGQDDSD